MQVAGTSAVILLGASLSACGADVAVDAVGGLGPLDVCSCMAARQTEPPPSPGELGPCNLCWARTVFVHEDEFPDGSTGNGVCHFDQQRCLDDPGCLAISGCVQGCRDADCVRGCLAEQSQEDEVSHDLYLDWLRCFCTECFDVCNAHPADGTCPAGS